jgi:small subunit ribosomal protein S16
MVKIRLRRMGMKHAPLYRVIVAPDRAPRDGRFIEILGTYNPRVDPPAVNIDQEKALEWLKKGAQPTDSAQRLLKNTGVFDRLAEWKQSQKNTTADATA